MSETLSAERRRAMLRTAMGSTIATVHANSGVAALYRLEQLVQESVVTVPRRLIAEAIDIIVFIAGRGRARRVETILSVDGLDPDGAYDVTDLTPNLPDISGSNP